jgi:hypothetical protein
MGQPVALLANALDREREIAFTAGNRPFPPKASDDRIAQISLKNGGS